MRPIVSLLLGLIVIALLAAPASAGPAPGGTTLGSASFSNTNMTMPNGDSEPAVAIAADGTTVFSSLSWRGFWTDVWQGPFGTTPAFQGTPDFRIDGAVGGGDADIDVGSTGTLHVTTLMFFFNPATQLTQLGVSAITCPNLDTSGNFSKCKAQLIDTTQADRQWVTSDGKTVYISYHDSGSSTLIHVQRSDDDGMTFHSVMSPIPGQDGFTGMATFNNDQGPIVADSKSHNVYAIYAAGEASVQKGTTANFNNIIVSKSSNKGLTWKPTLVYHAVLNTALNNVFPALAVDPTTGNLYASWSDAHAVWYAMSADQAATWSKAQKVNIAPAVTAVFPWVSAYSGKIDLVYYGTTNSSKDDPNATWQVYFAQSGDGANFVQSRVTEFSNHVGVICTFGTGCARGTRNLLDLFEVAIDPVTKKAAIIYTTDNTGATYKRADGTIAKLPMAAIAYEL